MPRTNGPSVNPKTQAGRVVRALTERYPTVRCALEHRNAFELLVATVLSAQCTDERVNRVTPALFARYPDAAALAGAELAAGDGWVGLRSHPRPGGSIAYGGPALPAWFDATLRDLVRA